MALTILISGLPNKLRLDGWWLADDFRGQAPPVPRVDHQPNGLIFGKYPVWILTLFLVLLADFLFWNQPLGLSVALFAWVFSAMIMLARPKPAKPAYWLIGMGVALVFNLPVIETVQPLSLMFSGLGILAVVIWAGGETHQSWQTLVTGVLRLVFLRPFASFPALWLMLNTKTTGSEVSRALTKFLLPAAFGAVFIWLFSIANPFLEAWLTQLLNLDLPSAELVLRLVFWAFVLMLVWPYLDLRAFRVVVSSVQPAKAPPQKTLVGVFVSPDSVRLSLLLFNGIFALQTGMDMLVLSGGMTLPEGMSYASYAHRGAYPLVVTALLAAGFAIGTRRMIIANRFLRGLVYLWLLQNLFLVLSAGFRLNLYVGQFALTHLRIAAFIWMFMVFVGLVLVFVQIAKQKSNGWLLGYNTALLLGVLYICSLVNFSYIIAAYNVEHAPDAYVYSDGYLCRLGPQALPVLLAQQAIDPLVCSHGRMPVFTPNTGWRDFGFRDWRLEQTLAEIKRAEQGP
ncbi:MAG: DUF4173 domain-containing protein [Rhodobacteraceae bacterium]|nr:DUF4173 domain-containing protein [Paracoccaceae bacterium]